MRSLRTAAVVGASVWAPCQAQEALSIDRQARFQKAWLQTMQYKLPGLLCRESPNLRQCMKADWPECIEATTPPVKNCIASLGPDLEAAALDRKGVERHTRALLRCAIDEILEKAHTAVPPWDPACLNVVFQPEVSDARIDIVFFQDGAIRVPSKGSVRLSKSPFVIHVSSPKGRPGIFSTRRAQPFAQLDRSRPHFLAPQPERDCPVETLCADPLALRITDALALLASGGEPLPADAAEELRVIASTYETVGQVVSSSLALRNFTPTQRAGSYEYRVSKVLPQAEPGGGHDKLWIVVVMNDQPKNAFPYARLRPIQIEIADSAAPSAAIPASPPRPPDTGR